MDWLISLLVLFGIGTGLFFSAAGLMRRYAVETAEEELDARKLLDEVGYTVNDLRVFFEVVSLRLIRNPMMTVHVSVDASRKKPEPERLLPSLRFTERQGDAMALGQRALISGDPVFDNAVLSDGHEVATLAALSAENRHRLLSLCAEGGAVQNGQIEARFEIPCVSATKAGRRLAELTHELIELTESLCAQRGTEPERLRDCVVQDPLPTVRRQALIALTRLFPESCAAKEAIEAAAKDPEALVRLQAATRLDIERRTELLEDVLRDTKSLIPCQVEALERLLEKANHESELTYLEEAWASNKVPLLRVAIAHCVKRGYDWARPRVLLLTEHSAVAADAVRALRTLGDSSCEPRLIELLRHEEEVHAASVDAGPEVRAAAIDALERIGTVLAVEPLQKIGKTDPKWRPRIARVIGAIKSRVDGGAGDLSLADIDGVGAVSVVELEGALSEGIVQPSAMWDPFHPTNE